MKDSQSTTRPQFEDVIIEKVIESVTEEELECPVAGEPLTQLSEVVGGTVVLDERYLAGYAAGIQRMQRALKQNNKSLLLRSFI